MVSSHQINQIDQKLEVGTTYTFKSQNGGKAKFKIANVDETHISGTDIDFKNYRLEKNQVYEVKKNNTLGTVLIAAGDGAALV